MGAKCCSYVAPLLVALWLGVLNCPYDAWSQDSGIGRKQCDELQARIDKVVEVWKNTSLSDDKKITQLMEFWVQSFAAMLSSTQNDPDAAKIAKDMGESIAGLLQHAKAEGAKSDAEVSPEVQQDLDLIRNRIKPYMAVMKLACPDLRIPDAVTK